MMLIFLPPLIFESAFSTDYHTFKKQLGKILLMAIPIILAATFLTALVMYYVLGYSELGLSWSACVMFGAIISATDPVAVVAILKTLGVSKSLGTIIEGESLFNDGTAMVIFAVAVSAVEGE